MTVRAAVGASAFAHVVFDLDGTLVDTAADLVAATNHVLDAFGRPHLAADTLRGYVGDGARTLVARALGTPDADRLEDAVARFLGYYERHLLDATRPFPGMAALVERLRNRGVAVSVLTNKAEHLSRAILEGLALAPAIASLVGGDTLATRKPDPAGLERLLARHDAARKATLMVGDSPIDHETARRARVPFCGVTWGFAAGALRALVPAPRLVDDARALEGVVLGQRSDSTRAGRLGSLGPP